MPGLEPGIQATGSSQTALDCRVKPGNDWVFLLGPSEVISL
jgi:hypothetical protein